MHSEDGTSRVDTAVLDVDGTLVDSVYQHTMAWATAFGEVDVDVPLWRLHRAVGIGGDRYVAEVAGDDVERRYGDRLRDRHDELFGREIDRVRPLPGAPELLRELGDRGLKVVMASSGVAEHTERLLRLVGAHRTSQGATSSSDVDQSKPAPDLIEAAIDKVDGDRAVVVGDAVWDVTAAVNAGVRSIGLLSGGFGEGELRAAGADQVFADAQDLLDHLDETLLRGRG
jgi:phosphoglycolate phosphatase-like HAD superfamily hydrolase